MKNQLTNSAILVMFLSILAITKAISCEDNLLISVYSPDGPFCDGDIVTVEVCGYWIGGGISSDVNENLSLSGDVDIVSKSSSYPCEVLEIRMNVLRQNKLKVKYDFEIEESQWEDHQTCWISETFTFDVKYEVLSCENNLLISVNSPDGPFCDGDIVKMEVCGDWLGGEINSDVNEYFSYSGDIDIVSESSTYPCEVLEIRMDFTKQNNLQVIYDFEIEATLIMPPLICSVSDTFTFDVTPTFNVDDDSIKWRQGDILEIQINNENVCYQWGEVIDNVEVDIDGETASVFSPNSSFESIFITTIKDKKPIPKDDFDHDYYVRLYDCDATNLHCKKVYFTSENFDYIPFYESQGLIETKFNIYPNPGDGIINISSSGILQNSTPFPTKVTDIYGNIIPTSDLIHAWNNTYIDISTIPSGFYFIYFKTGDETFEKFRYYKL